ncbi:MAG TPA: hypothetical protein VL175_02940 [Pirellulales bacterium]|nr:hypothetical protein [Pirellulales bacterium]
MLRQLFTMLIVACGVAQFAVAQDSDSQSAQYPRPKSVRRDNILVQHHASTAGEGWLRGQADWMRGYGESLRDQAEAACFNESAKGLAIQNRDLRIESYWNNKEEYEKWHQAHLPKVGPATKIAADEAKRARQGCTAQQVSATGKINWPVALKAEGYQGARQTLAALFVERAGAIETRLDATVCRKAQATVDKMLARLQAEVKTMPGNDYREAKQFLTSLKNDIVTSPRAVFIAAR